MAPPAEPYPSYELLTTLSTMMNLIRDYEDSFAKSSVYNTVVGLTTSIPRFRERLASIEFFHPPLILMPMRTGMVAYTWCTGQVNVHFAIP